MAWQSAHDTAAQKDCVTQAMWSALKVSAATGAVAGAGLAAGLRTSPGFRNSLGASGRAALVVLPAMAAFFLEIEWAINECAHKRRYGTTEGRREEPADILPERRA